MKRLLFASALIAVTVAALETDISIDQPGFYGRLIEMTTIRHRN